MLQVYADESKRMMSEAEDLVAKAIELRQAAQAALSRANELAFEYAKLKDAADAAKEEPDW